MAGATKWASTEILDGALMGIINNCTSWRLMVVTATSPEAIAGASCNQTGCLAISTNPAYPTTGAFTLGSSGANRYIAIGAFSCDEVLRDGTAGGVAIVASCSSQVMFVTSVTTVALTDGAKVNVATWSITINQPTA